MPVCDLVNKKIKVLFMIQQIFNKHQTLHRIPRTFCQLSELQLDLKQQLKSTRMQKQFVKKKKNTRIVQIAPLHTENYNIQSIIT